MAEVRAGRVATLAALVAFAAAAEPVGGPLLEPTRADSWGELLERLPRLEAQPDPSRAILRPRASEGFEPRYERIEILTERNAEPVKASLFAGVPGPATAFDFACEAGPAELRFPTFANHRHRRPVLELRAGAAAEEITWTPGIVETHRVPLPGDACRDGTLRVRLRARVRRTGLLLGEPVLLTAAKSELPPVVLLSIDTQRADFWEHGRERPEHLDALARSAIRFTRVYSPTASTQSSHRVMLSGLSLQESTTGDVDEDTSWVARLRAAGYRTLGFVGGGYLRATFGFGSGLPPDQRAGRPGFALGFDLYVEGRLRGRDQELLRRLKPRAQEEHVGSYTLGASLERSLRWFASHPGEPAFHFVHGYDVHGYRSVRAESFAQVTGRLPADERSALEACMERVGARVDSGWAIHYPPTQALTSRAERGELEDADGCHRRVAHALYEARVDEAQTLLDAYLRALGQLGIYDDALIVVTSDHGEVLLDDRTPEGRVHWGHNRLTLRDHRVPLWIKPPGAAPPGRVVETPAGLVDLRAILAGRLGLDLGESRGVDLLAGERRETPIEVADGRWTGAVLADGALCAWPDADHGERGETLLRTQAAGAWSTPSGAEAEACSAARAQADPLSFDVNASEIPAEMREELRALGYVE